MAKSWKRSFEDPIDLPRGRRLVTLEDAGNYITKLPKAEHEAPEWQAAMQALMLVARGGADDAGQDRRLAGATPQRRSGVYGPQGYALAKAEVEAGSIKRGRQLGRPYCLTCIRL
jgi:hypothetical protein